MSGDSSQTNPIVTAPNAPQIDQRALVGLPPADSQQEDKGLTFLKALKNPENADSRMLLLRTTFLMIFIPIGLFFFGRSVAFRTVSNGGRWTDDDSLTYSGILAVIGVNIVTIGFILYAFAQKDHRIVTDNDESNVPALPSEPELPTEQEKKPKKKKVKRAAPAEQTGQPGEPVSAHEPDTVSQRAGARERANID